MSYTIREAKESDVPRLNELVNSAYRGESSKKGWTTEADLLGGVRIDEDRLREILRDPQQKVLCLFDQSGHMLSTVNLKRFTDAKGEGCYLGMLTVDPELQAAGLGKVMIEESERTARLWGATRMTMTVIQVRPELLAYYQRRGYQPTGEIEPFPYGDMRFGEPKRSDLHFIVLEKSL